MRVKQTAKKITASDEQIVVNSEQIDQENINNNSSDNVNDLSDNEVEIVVECRRDLEGNQFLLDGTLVIEPAEVADVSNETEQKDDQKVEEVDFAQFIKDIQFPTSDKPTNNVATSQSSVKKSQTHFPFSTPQISVKCTACNSKFSPFVENLLHKHPVLEVILCKVCIENQKDKYFVIDEEDNKETLCRWCVEGGSLICCDFCSKSYCKTCIKRNLGRTVLSEILNQDDSVQWKCFSCDPTPIKILQESFTKISNELDKFKAFMKTNKKPIPRLDSINKKRSSTKAFPGNSTSNVGLTSGKPINPSGAVKIMNQSQNPNINTINLLNNMEGFGTEWYIRNVNIDNILAGIDKVDCRSLLHAINSSKKCVEAFYSDIRNLENEISKAGSSTDISAIVSMFKSVYRHHIFNRFCQIQSRIEEDRKARFIPQTINGMGGSFKESNHNSNGPNLMINSVISKAPINYNNNNNNNNSNNNNNNNNKRPNNSFTPNIIAKKMRQITNGERKSTPPIMYSIDLTDDTDKVESVAKRESVEKLIEKVSEEIHRTPKEIVDLCNDDDSTIVSYPVVRMNFNNQLFSENKS